MTSEYMAIRPTSSHSNLNTSICTFKIILSNLIGSSFRIEEKSTAIYQHVKHVKLDPGLAEFFNSF